MLAVKVILIVVLSLIALFFLTTYVCFRITFYVPTKKKIR